MDQRINRRKFLGTAGAGAVGASIGVAGWKGLAPGSTPARRNVVLIVIDTLRPDHLGCYGNRAMRTPNIDALARESVRFTRVFPEAMPTVPARRSILSGRRAYPFRDWEPWFALSKRPGWQPIMPGTETLITALRKAGYWTGYVSDNPFLALTETFAPFRGTVGHFRRIHGQRAFRARPVASEAEALEWLPPVLRNKGDVDRMRHYLANNGYARDESQQAAARVFTSASELLGTAARRRRPFCLVVDSFSPHEPWAPPRRYLDLYGDPDYRGPEVSLVRYGASDYLTPTQLRRLRTVYKASVTMVDRWLGRFMDRLHDLRLQDDTAVVLLSDHGIYLGEHGQTGKGESVLHPELIQVPLLLRHPDGHGAGSTSDYFATTSDIAPTLVSLAGVGRPKRFEGTDLSPIAEGGQPGQSRSFAYGGYGGRSFIRDERWALVARNDGGSRRLFDLAADPREQRDVAGRHPKVVRELWRRLVRAAGGRPPRYSLDHIRSEPRRLRVRRRR